MTNNLNIRTLCNLFENRRDIQIPVYQRAYSWGREQCNQFFDDLVEQKGKSYHFGLFIFECDAEKDTYFVIDGQQRLTTAILFFAALAKAIGARNENVIRIKEMYLTDGFRTVEEDDDYFKQIIREFTCGDKRAETISQGKIKDAFDLLGTRIEKHLKENGLEKTMNLQKSLENAKIGIFDIDNKGEASQVFEYQNNRGISASDFEIIKAYLIHQIYIISSPSDCESHINEVQKNISKIYRNLEAISEHFTEDDILRCWFNLYEYTQDVDYNIDGIKWCLSSENEDKPVTDICLWIKNFFVNFEKITNAAKVLLKKNAPQISNLFLIRRTPYWPVIMLAIVIKENTKLANERLNRLAKLLEVLWFKYEVSSRRKDSLPEWAYYYFNEVSEEKSAFEEIYKKIEDAIDSGFGGWWTEFKEAVSKYLKEDDHFKFKATTRYVLWQYENHLRENHEHKLPRLGHKKYRAYNTIEHIQPQNTEWSYIHKLGNLTLLTKPDNSIASSSEFDVKKQKVYKKYFDKDNPEKMRLFQFCHIIEKDTWREQEVDERFGKIKTFVKGYFRIDS